MPDREELKDAIRRAGSKELRSALTAAAPPPDRRNRTLNWRGPWQQETTYQAGDVVSHEGSSWRALGESQDSPPPSMLWEYVAKKGDRGPSGAGLTGPQGPQGPAGPGSDLDIEDEGIAQGIATILDFVGAGVTAAVVGTTATITVPGGGSGVDVSDQGAPEGTATVLDFTGAGVSVAFAAGTATITIAGGGGSADFLSSEKWSIV